MIRKLKIMIACKERELRTVHPNSRDRVRAQLGALKMALRLRREMDHRTRSPASAVIGHPA